MKKIFGLLCLVLGLFVVVSCSDDDTTNPYAHVSAITVDSASVLFRAAPDTGTVTVTALNGITKVESEQAWCQATVSGNKVTVTVTQNGGLASRASLIKIYSGDDYATVTVQQMGFIFSIGVLSILTTVDSTQTLTYALKHNADVAVSSTADWITVSATDNSLAVKLAANTTGHIRYGYVRYTNGTVTDSIPVTQYEFAKDIAGEYNLYYYASTTAKRRSKINATIKNDSTTNIYSDDGSINVTFASTFYPNSLRMVYESAQYVGMSGSNYLYLAYRFTDGTWSGYNLVNSSYATFVYDESDQSQYAEVKGVGDRLSSQFAAWALRAFSAKSMVAPNDLGYILSMYSPVFLKK